MSKHTPGPWISGHGIRSETNIDGTIGGFERHGDGDLVATTHTPRSIQAKSPEQQARLHQARAANAALIAAAPDLLTALGEIAGMVEALHATPDAMDDPIWQVAREAIAKTKGGAK